MFVATHATTSREFFAQRVKSQFSEDRRFVQMLQARSAHK
jgi:hypothetical protein